MQGVLPPDLVPGARSALLNGPSVAPPPHECCCLLCRMPGPHKRGLLSTGACFAQPTWHLGLRCSTLYCGTQSNSERHTVCQLVVASSTEHLRNLGPHKKGERGNPAVKQVSLPPSFVPSCVLSCLRTLRWGPRKVADQARRSSMLKHAASCLVCGHWIPSLPALRLRWCTHKPMLVTW